MVANEDAPMWAAHWLAAGYDGPALRTLAGLGRTEVREVQDVLPEALEDCGVALPADDVAAAEVLFTDLARSHLAGEIDWLGLATTVYDVYLSSRFDPGVLDLPLARVTYLDEEWGHGCGRPAEELAAEVRAACLEQLNLPGAAAAPPPPAAGSSGG